MSFGVLGVAALAAYLLALAVIGELARRSRRSATPADHFLANRELGVFVLFLTLYATAYSGNSLLGYPGEAYRRGFSWIMATGFMMSIIVVFHALAPRLRPLAVREGFVTPGDYVRHRFGGQPGGRTLLALVSVLIPVITTRSRLGFGIDARDPARANATHAFAPPKAKLFEMAACSGNGRALFGT